MSYTDELKQALQHEYFGGEARNSLTNVNTKRIVRDCPDDTLESVIMDWIDKLQARGISVQECFVTSREIIFTV